MSYTTEELIKVLEISLGHADMLGLSPEAAFYDAIIAKLRAADKLCEAAKEADHLLMQNNYDSEEGTREVLRKAISEYEGKP